MLMTTNMEDKDVDLELQLGSTKYSSGAGAIASAGSRVNMAFRAPHPLSELVWSPNNGLSLKHANSDKKLFLWNKGTREDGAADQEQLATSLAMHDVDDAFGNKLTSVMPSRSHPTLVLGSSHDHHDDKSNTILEEAGTSHVAPRIETFVDNGEEDLCSLQNDQIAEIAEIGKSMAGLSTLADERGDCKAGMAINRLFQTKFIRKANMNQNSGIEFYSSCQSIVGLDDVDHCEPLTAKLSQVHLEFQKKWAGEGTSATGEMNETKISSPICLNQKKEKGKVASNEDIYGRTSNDKHVIVKSHDRAEQLSKGVKRSSYDLEPIVGTKRMRKYHGIPGLESFVLPDSPFTNWVSNMVNGVAADANREDSLSLALALTCPDNGCGKNPEGSFIRNKRHDSPGLAMGFQTVFRSLYCAQKGNDSIEGTGKYLVDEKMLLENMPRSCHGKNACDILACSGEKEGAIRFDPGKQTDGTSQKTAPHIGLEMKDGPEKSNLQTSPWITRFCKEIARKTDECSICSPEANLDHRVIDAVPIDQNSSANDISDCRTYACEKWIQRFTANAEASIDSKSTSEHPEMINPIKKFRSSEAMASVFARRLGAFKHVPPSMREQTPMHLIRCFFCGCGHYLSECPNVTETELEDLLVKTSLVDRMEESSCLCIRCFQSDHWAISCPLAPSSGHCRPDLKASIISHYTAVRVELCGGHGRRSSYHQEEEDAKLISVNQKTWNLDNSLSENHCALNGKRTSGALREGEKDKWKHPGCDDVIAQTSTAAPLEICLAVRNLRLSRGDILRCMNSNLSLSHLKGYFLRLRIGKLEPGPAGESGYYVACITAEDAQEHSNAYCKSKRSILVDVGGGIKSWVESQYVSNHDFLKEEIKAWWSRTVESGCRIPSLNELNSKFNDRKSSLGF